MIAAGSSPPVSGVGWGGPTWTVCPLQSGWPGTTARGPAGADDCAPLWPNTSVGPTRNVATSSSFFMDVASLLDRPEIGGDVVQLLVRRIIELHQHLLVRGAW